MTIQTIEEIHNDKLKLGKPIKETMDVFIPDNHISTISIFS